MRVDPESAEPEGGIQRDARCGIDAVRRTAKRLLQVVPIAPAIGLHITIDQWQPLGVNRMLWGRRALLRYIGKVGSAREGESLRRARDAKTQGKSGNG